jgi:hypothetical protein
MRFLLMLLIAFAAVPLQAQRVFRASAIDMEQDSRLDVLESQVAAIHDAIGQMVKPAPNPVPNAKPVSKPVVEPKAVVVARQTLAQPVSASNRYSTGELRTIIQSMRPGGWRGPVYADVEPESWARQHLQSDHGFTSAQVSGLTQSECLILHDLRHGGKISPFRSSQSVQSMTVQPVIVAAPANATATVQRSYNGPVVNRTVKRQVTQPQYQMQGGCPNGQCPTQRSQSSTPRFRLFPGLFR